MTSIDSFKCCKTLKVGSKTYAYYSLPVAEKNGLKGISRLPFSLKVLLENLLRNEDGRTVTKEDIQAFAQWLKTKTSDREIPFRPARVLMQDFTGVPAVVDLAAMRDAMKHLGGDPEEDQSAGAGRSRHRPFGRDQFLRQRRRVQEERRGRVQAEPGALQIPEMGAEVVREFPRRAARHRHLPSGQSRISVADRLDRAGQGQGRRQRADHGDRLSRHAGRHRLHTTMVNGLSVLGWGVGGIEAEAAMLGQPYSMVLPEVIGVKLTGKLKEGVTATDLVLTVTQMLRKRGVVGKFVEFFGPGLADLTIADRATIGNMAPEYGATCGFFPIDDDTIDYLRRHRPRAERDRAGRGLRQGAGHVPHQDDARSGLHRRAQARARPASSRRSPARSARRTASRSRRSRRASSIAMDKEFNKGSDGGGKDVFELHPSIATAPMDKDFAKAGRKPRPVEGRTHDLGHGDVVIAAITSCTNTSNPSVMIARGPARAQGGRQGA